MWPLGGSHSAVRRQGTFVVSTTSLTANAHSACSLHDAILQTKHHGKGKDSWSQSHRNVGPPKTFISGARCQQKTAVSACTFASTIMLLLDMFTRTFRAEGLSNPFDTEPSIETLVINIELEELDHDGRRSIERRRRTRALRPVAV